MAKGEITCFEQFILYSLVFKSRLQQRLQKASICGKGLALSHMQLCFNALQQTTYKRIVAKGWKMSNFSLFQCFQLDLVIILWFIENRLSGLVVEHPPRVWMFTSLIPGRVITETLKMVVMARRPPWCSGLFTSGSNHYDWLAGVRINGPVILVTYPENAVV